MTSTQPSSFSETKTTSDPLRNASHSDADSRLYSDSNFGQSSNDSFNRNVMPDDTMDTSIHPAPTSTTMLPSVSPLHDISGGNPIPGTTITNDTTQNETNQPTLTGVTQKLNEIDFNKTGVNDTTSKSGGKPLSNYKALFSDKKTENGDIIAKCTSEFV